MSIMTKEDYFKLKEEVNQTQQAYLNSLPANLTEHQKFAKLLKMLTPEDHKRNRLLEDLAAKFELTFEERIRVPTPSIDILKKS